MDIDLLASVELRMREVIGVSDESGNIVIRAVLDHFISGGSRVRARLSLYASARLGLGRADSLALAAVCELIHNASLIQDDLLDRAALRRGLPSIWSTYGDATAVCAGDLLLSSAFAAIGDLQSTQFVCPVLSLVHCRTREVILGQGTEQFSSPDTMEGYEAVAVAKSASLLSLPLELSLLVSGHRDALPGAQRAATAFATAYQMMDDLEDYPEDRRSGSLNVVSVALRSGSPTYEAACARVLQRIEEVLRVLHDEARALPMGCGSAMIDHAETMRSRMSLPVKLFLEGKQREGSAAHAR
jgi:geranylgeranyl pyrophosphate synthase